MNPYRILNVTRDATLAEIKEAYRKLVSGLHPDKHSDVDKEEQLKVINAAYNLLKRPESRRQYDQTGRVDSGQPDIQDMAESAIFNMAVEILESSAVTQQLSDTISQRVRGDMVNINTLINNCNEKIKHYEKRMKQIKSDNDLSTRLKQTLADKISQNKTSIEKYEYDLKIGDKVLEVVLDIYFEVDPQAPPQFRSTSSTGFWGS